MQPTGLKAMIGRKMFGKRSKKKIDKKTVQTPMTTHKDIVVGKAGLTK